MTRRVRFSPLLAVGVFAGAVGLTQPQAAHATDVPFVTQPPINSTTSVRRVHAADVDGDGDTDVLSAAQYSLVWNENTGDGSSWTTRTIATTAFARTVFGLQAADLDRDGDLDVVVSDFQAPALTWYENAAGNGSAWTAHELSTTLFPSATGMSVADVDGDGDRDVLVDAFGTHVLWLENAAGNGTTWTSHTIATTGAASPRDLTAADVDRDGDVDLATASLGGVFAWHENTAGNGSAWVTHTIATGALSPGAIVAADVDRDGDTDLLATDGGTVVWYENAAGNGASWTRRTITTAALQAVAVFAADVDGDGDVDAISASYGDDKLAWYENTAGNGAAWTARTVATLGSDPLDVLAADLDGDGDTDIAHAAYGGNPVGWHRNESIHVSACFVPTAPIATAAVGASAVLGSDVDGDGQIDVLSTGLIEDAVLWHENAAGDGSSWTTRTITTAADFPQSLAEADVDGDGDRDVLSASNLDDKIAWYENTAGDGTAWATRTITTGANGAIGVATADVDGDGDTDVLSTSYTDGRVAWYANTAGDGSAWTTVTIATVVRIAGMTVTDIDGDGDTDVVSTSDAVGNNRVNWYENTAGNGSAWMTHTIATIYDPEPVSVSDVDGDGDMDVLSGSYNAGIAYWHENASGNGSLWITHVITTEVDGITSIVAADLDRDGDVDALSSVWGDTRLAWHENTAGNGSAWVTHTVGTASGPWNVSVVDVDGDGDQDALWAAWVGGGVGWFESREGSVSFTVTDTAPSTADNDAVVSMLRLVATHLGRPGDGDVELASLGLLFEESPGDPLSTAEANALIESVRVYRDGDGNGVFDPALDVLVTSVPTLALTGGIATLVLPDGDPNLQVGLGTPRTYFIVVELTANASTQAPNQLRLTHLAVGASASAAEHRAFDIPLRLACPTNVSSSIKQAVPVELIGFTVE